MISARAKAAAPLLAALVSAVLWASAFLGIRVAGRSFDAGSLALGRLVVGSVALGVLLALRGWTKPSPSDLRLILLAGLLWFGLYNVALNSAEQQVDAGTAAIIVNVGPLLIVAFAALFLGERFSSRFFVGATVSFAGVVLIGSATASAGAPLGGILLALAAAVAFAGGMVAQKPVLGRLPGVQVTWMCCTVGAVACLPFAGRLIDDVAAAPQSGLAWMAYLGVFPTALGFTTWSYALARSDAGRVAATTYLVPPIAVLMSWVALDEVPVPIAILGGALCLAGVVMARRSPAPRELRAVATIEAFPEETACSRDSAV